MNLVQFYNYIFYIIIMNSKYLFFLNLTESLVIIVE